MRDIFQTLYIDDSQSGNKDRNIQGVPIAIETGISLIILPVSQQLGALQTHTTDTFFFISHTTNALLFKFRCNIFIGVRIFKEMPGSVTSGTLRTKLCFHTFCTRVKFLLLSEKRKKLVWENVAALNTLKFKKKVIIRSTTVIGKSVEVLWSFRSLFQCTTISHSWP
jgi:hypothetical protein